MATSPLPPPTPSNEAADDPDVQARIDASPRSSYAINYPYLNLLKDRMEYEGLYADDLIARSMYPVHCASCTHDVVPADHPTAGAPCPNGCGWCYLRPTLSTDPPTPSS